MPSACLEYRTKVCRVCGEYFISEGKYRKMCDKCKTEKRNKRLYGK